MSSKKPNVLVFSIDVWNSVSGSDTFTNLLSEYSPDNVANIYFKSGIPTSSVCNKYFFISENSVIKSIFNKNVKSGKVVEKGTQESSSADMDAEVRIEKSRYSFFTKYRRWLFVYAREFLWKIGRWKTAELDEFVENFKPDVLFFPIESYIYFLRVIRYVISKTNAPAIGIIWDDNFTYKVHKYNIGYRIHRFFLRKHVKALAKRCSKLFVINSKMQRECKAELSVDSDILTKGAKLTGEYKPNSYTDKPIRIVYTGKLNIGRFDTVCAVADAIAELNKGEKAFELHIYSGTSLSAEEKQRIEKDGTRFMGSVTQDKITDIQNEADILLMAEALKGKHKYAARLSFSTKIVDYLAGGKCILAVGPEDIAPIEYLKENDAALIASSKQAVLEVLGKVLSDNQLLNEYGKKAYDVALKNHDIAKIHSLLYSSFSKVCE